MARSNTCCLVLLFLCGALLLEMNPGTTLVSAVVCPQYCLDVDYMTCPSTGDKQLSPKCNCCLSPKGCTLHLTDGTSVSCS
ncbi:proteinase inhibitor PSI-1.2 [Syzygium oleosum]|uniref:proteinase inhibitor PSI-1.2 n=1 Tax=Syzygium oleosum TaxID=219896 RepID=UPI0024BA3E76|nr:proteinase inhibitor PSI-1.2 [Syzygium oleosum]